MIEFCFVGSDPENLRGLDIGARRCTAPSRRRAPWSSHPPAPALSLAFGVFFFFFNGKGTDRLASACRDTRSSQRHAQGGDVHFVMID